MTERRRRPKGEGSVFFRKSDERWVVKVPLPSGKTKTVYAKDERDGERKRRKILAEIEAGRPVQLGRSPTVGEYLTHWLDNRIASEVEAGHLDADTADSYRQMVEGHLAPTELGRARIHELSAEDVRSWQRARLKTISSRGKPFAPRTVGIAHATLRRALNDAMSDEILGRNVAALVKLPVGQSRQADPPTEDELSAVFAEMIEDDLRVLWLTMLAFGPRRGEALGMRWSLTDLDAATTKLRKQIRRVRGEVNKETGKRRTKLVEKDLKTKASRATIGLPESLVEVLKAHRKRQAAERLASRLWVDPDLVFTTSIGTALEPRNVNRSWSKVVERAGVEPGRVRLHDLRHAAATLAFEAGADLKEIQAMLRHTRVGTTADIYVDVFESVRRGTASKMDTVLRKIASAS